MHDIPFLIPAEFAATIREKLHAGPFTGSFKFTITNGKVTNLETVHRIVPDRRELREAARAAQ